MKAPEKIYLQVCGDCNQADCDNCKFEDLEDNVTWAKDHIFPNDIEYTCTDVFIEKAVEWFKLYVLNNDTIDIFEMEDEFKNYMKGE